jgi:hypothetical protein
MGPAQRVSGAGSAESGASRMAGNLWDTPAVRGTALERSATHPRPLARHALCSARWSAAPRVQPNPHPCQIVHPDSPASARVGPMTRACTLRPPSASNLEDAFRALRDIAERNAARRRRSPTAVEYADSILGRLLGPDARFSGAGRGAGASRRAAREMEWPGGALYNAMCRSPWAMERCTLQACLIKYPKAAA